MKSSTNNHEIKNNSLFIIFLCLSVIAIPMSFPLQVLFMEPNMALLPYIFLFLSLLLILPIYNLSKINYLFINIPNFLYIFVFFVIFSQLIQIISGFISFYEFIGSLIFFILPILFYIPLRFYSPEYNLRLILIFLVLGGAINALFFVYDTVSRFLFTEITTYANLAFDYTIEQQNIANEADANTARISLISRSHGLMPSHTISSFWIMVSYFALMALYNFKAISKIMLTALYFCILLVCMNFSSILNFLFIVSFIYFDFYKILFLRASINNLILIISGIITLIGIIFTILLFIGNPLVEFFMNVLMFQVNALFDYSDIGIISQSYKNSFSFWEEYISNFKHYFEVLIEFPFSVLIGTGFSGTIMMYGGDTGIIETIAKFGPAIFIIIMFAYIRTIFSSIKNMHLNRNNKVKNQFKFIASIFLSILIYEYHYSIWDQKYVFPLLIFALAIHDSHLYEDKLKFNQKN